MPTVEEELNSYGKHSEYFEDGHDLNKSQDEKSQKAKKKLPDEDKIYEPLPCLEALVELSRRLKSALSASVAGQRSKKVLRAKVHAKAQVSAFVFVLAIPGHRGHQEEVAKGQGTLVHHLVVVVVVERSLLVFVIQQLGQRGGNGQKEEKEEKEGVQSETTQDCRWQEA